MARVVLAATCVGFGAVTEPLVAALAIASVALIHHMRPIVRSRRRSNDVSTALPDTIELLVLTIHVGLTPVQAVRELSRSAPRPTRHGFAAVVQRIERGEPLADALRELSTHLGTAMHPVADALANAERYGLPLGPALELLASEARAQRRRLNEAGARRLPVRLAFPLVFCTLPSFVLVAIAPAMIAALSSLSSSF